MVSEAYLQSLLEQIARQTRGLGADQTECFESGSSLADQWEHEPAQRVIMYKNPNRPIMVQHDFLGRGGQAKCNVEAPHGVISNTILKARLVAARVTRSNPINT